MTRANFTIRTCHELTRKSISLNRHMVNFRGSEHVRRKGDLSNSHSKLIQTITSLSNPPATTYPHPQKRNKKGSRLVII
jgi:hypothetical protein